MEVRPHLVPDDSVRGDEHPGDLHPGHGLQGLSAENHPRIPLLHRLAALLVRTLLRYVIHGWVEIRGQEGQEEGVRQGLCDDLT